MFASQITYLPIHLSRYMYWLYLDMSLSLSLSHTHTLARFRKEGFDVNLKLSCSTFKSRNRLFNIFFNSKKQPKTGLSFECQTCKRREKSFFFFFQNFDSISKKMAAESSPRRGRWSNSQYWISLFFKILNIFALEQQTCLTIDVSTLNSKTLNFWVEMPISSPLSRLRLWVTEPSYTRNSNLEHLLDLLTIRHS